MFDNEFTVQIIVSYIYRPKRKAKMVLIHFVSNNALLCDVSGAVVLYLTIELLTVFLLI